MEAPQVEKKVWKCTGFLKNYSFAEVPPRGGEKSLLDRTLGVAPQKRSGKFQTFDHGL